MPRVNRQAIEDRLARLAKEIDAIDATRPSTYEEFISADCEDLRTALEHRIFMSAQVMIDIATHIIAAQGEGAPATYAEAFEGLARKRIVPREVIEGVRGAAGLRNAIAHLYLDLDQEALYGALRRTPDMKRFAVAIWEWLEGQ